MGLILRHSPHRVFVTRAGRAEVYQAIPAPGGKAPEGPHTHVLPKLLAHGRTHAATEPIPKGWVSCAHLYPAHPLRDGYGRARPFDGGRYAAFQRLLSRYGDIEHVRLKRNVVKALNAGAGPEAIAMPADRFAQASIRVALRQLKASERDLAGPGGLVCGARPRLGRRRGGARRERERPLNARRRYIHAAISMGCPSGLRGICQPIEPDPGHAGGGS